MRSVLLLSATVVVAFAAPAASQSYTIQDLGTFGGATANGLGLDELDDSAGWAANTAGGWHAFLHDGAALLDLGTFPGGFNSQAYDVNESGAVVGWSSNSAGGWHAFRLSGGVMTSLGTLPGGPTSMAYGINDLGDVVGWSANALGAKRAAFFAGGTVTDLNTLIPGGSGWTLFEAWDISDAGDIVGWGTLGGNSRAFRMTPSGLRLRGPAPGLAGQANTLYVTGAPAGSTVYLVYGLQAGSTPVPGCPGLTVAIQNPTIAGSVVASAGGTATFTARVPGGASGLTVRAQAVVPSACTVSNLLIHYFP